MMTPIGVAIFSASLSWLCALMIARHGIKWGLIDIPNERSSHASIVPRGGGFGLPLAVAFTGLIFSPSRPLVVGASIFISMIAFLNDRREISAWIRLLAGVVAANVIAYPVFLMVRITMSSASAFLIYSISILYIVTQANFYNFMDGINGIAAIEAIISFTMLGIHLQLCGEHEMALICIAVAAGAIGFLPMNFPRARAFLGDVGSVFLGFLFAAMIVTMSRSPKEFLVLALLQGLFSIDCVMTILRRVLKKQNIFRAHKQHLYQRLVHNRGWSHTKTTLLFGAVQICFGVAALLCFSASIVSVIFLWLCLLLAYLAGEYLAFHIVIKQ